MTFRIGILIGLAAGVLLAGIVCGKRASREPVGENERWQKHTDNLNRYVKEEKATDNLRKRYD